MKTVLIVEDNAELAKLLELILRRAGYAIVVAEDGVSALEAYRQAPPDLVLLDIMLPQMDGYEVCERLRGELHAEAPIIMLSSLDSPLDMERSRAVGATDHVAKPFDRDRLLATIRQNLGEAPEAAA
ncbi:MAG TPA: response regulator [Armatimonadota bacterium]|nr:response regulator [Armatimonadota bacterium]HOS44648.1 response regulator [Armatimonadota bacterium]